MVEKIMTINQPNFFKKNDNDDQKKKLVKKIIKLKK
jgi:hypothetical protein